MTYFQLLYLHDKTFFLFFLQHLNSLLTFFCLLSIDGIISWTLVGREVKLGMEHCCHLVLGRF